MLYALVRVGDCNRKQSNREAIATSWGSELCDRETNMLYALVRVGDCNRKQSNREAIATCCTSEMSINKFIAVSSVCKRFT